MPSSLPPPPRKTTSSNTASSSLAPSYRYPKTNPTLGTISDPSLLDQNDDEDLDQALAHLLGQTHIDGSQSPYHINQSQGQQTPLHHPQCKHHRTNGTGARPLSIASVSTLSSGSFSSYGSSHSRRVSQPYLSPLSPTLSDPTGSYLSGSYFEAVKEDDESKQIIDGENLDDASITIVDNTSSSYEHNMAFATSSYPSCTYCPSVRSDSICSTNTFEDQQQHGQQTTQNHRNSIHQLYDSNRLAVLREYVPSEVRNRLSYHLDECWFLHFSPSGHYMASTGLDHSILIWQDLV
ncbi:hypothetical protein BGZ49_007924, partial [Haplosporangium sp. Z 27]